MQPSAIILQAEVFKSTSIEKSVFLDNYIQVLLEHLIRRTIDQEYFYSIPITINLNEAKSPGDLNRDLDRIGDRKMLNTLQRSYEMVNALELLKNFISTTITTFHIHHLKTSSVLNFSYKFNGYMLVVSAEALECSTQQLERYRLV